MASLACGWQTRTRADPRPCAASFSHRLLKLAHEVVDRHERGHHHVECVPHLQGNILTPDSTWSVAGIGDFNGDGKTDVLWRQSGTESLAEWQMNGATVSSSASITSQGHVVTPDSTWSVVGVGDFNGDGKADILWRQSSTEALSMWLMNGSFIGGSATPTYPGSAVTPDSSWNIIEIGDFNRDSLGMADARRADPLVANNNVGGRSGRAQQYLAIASEGD